MPTTIHVLVQSVTAFAVLLILARVMGKRQVSQLHFFDYIAGITIGNIAASWSLDDTTGIDAIAGLLVWSLLSILMSWIQRKSYRGRILLDGRPTILMKQGQVMEDNLKKAKLSLDELMIMLRKKDVFKLSDAEFAVLETNGDLNVMKKTEVQPITPKDAGWLVVQEREPRLLIIDGHVMERSLEAEGYTKEWLLGEVMKQGAGDFSDVFVAQIDSNGNLYVDLYRDRMKEPTIKQKPLVAAKLRKIQADLEGFALDTENPEAKQSYGQMAQKLQELLRDSGPFLRE